MTIQTYVKKNYGKLPKSTFIDHGSEKELVIVEEINNWDEGYGHHCYEGIGVDAEGMVFSCHSGGCSCNCDVSFGESMTDLSNLKWQDIEFERLRVDFSSYD
jgi:hypothetical protein